MVGGIRLRVSVIMCCCVCSLSRSTLMFTVSVRKMLGYSLSWTWRVILPSSLTACRLLAEFSLLWSSSIHDWSVVSSSLTSLVMSSCTAVLSMMA